MQVETDRVKMIFDPVIIMTYISESIDSNLILVNNVLICFVSLKIENFIDMITEAQFFMLNLFKTICR